MCYAVLRDTWLDSCRPIFGIDGCFLKNPTKGQLLAAVGRDANNHIYPLAWAVVNVENKDNWIWFLQKLKKDLDMRNGDGFTLVSDRQKVSFDSLEFEFFFLCVNGWISYSVIFLNAGIAFSCRTRIAICRAPNVCKAHLREFKEEIWDEQA